MRIEKAAAYAMAEASFADILSCVALRTRLSAAKRGGAAAQQRYATARCCVQENPTPDAAARWRWRRTFPRHACCQAKEAQTYPPRRQHLPPAEMTRTVITQRAKHIQKEELPFSKILR